MEKARKKRRDRKSCLRFATSAVTTQAFPKKLDSSDDLVSLIHYAQRNLKPWRPIILSLVITDNKYSGGANLAIHQGHTFMIVLSENSNIFVLDGLDGEEVSDVAWDNYNTVIRSLVSPTGSVIRPKLGSWADIFLSQDEGGCYEIAGNLENAYEHSGIPGIWSLLVEEPCLARGTE